ncbi:MAG: PIN domain-containing protein [Chloroflexota bacterium]
MSATDPTRAILDACILIPAALRDTLLRTAAVGLYQPCWSEDILAEVQRNLVAHRMTTPGRALRLVATMRRAFPQAMVEGYTHRVAELETHPDDRHVLAAAIVADAGVIVTANLRHFPVAALAPHDVIALDPDTFLFDLVGRAPLTLARVILDQAADLQNPPATPGDILTRLHGHTPRFVRSVRAILDQGSPGS